MLLKLIHYLFQKYLQKQMPIPRCIKVYCGQFDTGEYTL